MITIILKRQYKHTEIDMPAMYEELQLALWKLGLDRVPEKYTLLDLGATFRYQSPLEYFVLRLLEGEMTLLDAVSAIYTVIAPPRPIMAQVQILSSGFQSITELRQEIDRMIKSTAQFGSTCFFPVQGWLVGLDGEMEPVGDAVMLKHAEVIGERFSGCKEATFYDGMITCSTILGKAVCKLVWNMDPEENTRYLELAMAGIPEDFSGRILEVPVGTGVLTMPVHKTLPHADITCLDYSADMMAVAQRRAEKLGISKVQFRQGDVGALPFEDNDFDLVLSLNGFHAFPDKESAFRETFRVLKPGGIFCGCFYIAGQNKRTDWFIDHLYMPKGFFTPPFDTATSLCQRLSKLYESMELETVESMACFTCRKGE